MIHTVLRLIVRFRKDESGAFAIIFALVAIVILAMSGATVDFTMVQQARTRAQVALDSAVLALQPAIYATPLSTTQKNIQAQAQTLLLNRLQDASSTVWIQCPAVPTQAPCATVQTPTIDTVNGQLSLQATIKVPLYFVSLVGVTSMSPTVTSVATRKKLNLEVAMVLDNSGSMANTMGYNDVEKTGASRMTTLQQSATCAVNILFYGVTSCSASTTGLTLNPNVQIGIVPFTQAVNAGYSIPAADLDRTGTTGGSVTVDNFDYAGTIVGDSGFYGVDRVALINGMTSSTGSPMTWGGCLQARANPYDTNAATPSSSTPATLYTPYLAVDEPDSNTSGPFYNDYISDTPPACAIPSTCTITATTTTTTTTKNGRITTTTSTTTKYAQIASDGETSTSATTCNCSGLPTTTLSIGAVTTQTCYPPFQPANLTQLQYQTRLCKYQGASLTSPADPSHVLGPNGDCPAAAVLPLSATPSTTISAINAMQANGGTNITEGSAWGFRLLSPGDPFNARAFGSANSKVLIIMTDGANTIYPGSNMNDDEYSSAYGFPSNGRLLPASSSTSQLQSATSLQAEMDNRLSTVCTNAKSAGISVYTIGIDVKDSGSTSAISAQNKTNLTNCATNSGDAYFPNTAADLQAAFVSIANQLAALRLAQ